MNIKKFTFIIYHKNKKIKMDIYKQVLFQIRIDQSYYFGILTYNFLKYSYLEFTIEKCEQNGEYNYYKSKSDKINESMTQYIDSFIHTIMNEREYTIYCIAEIGDPNSAIIFDNRISIDCVIDEKEKKFTFLDKNIIDEEFTNMQEEVYIKNNIWNFTDYEDDEEPFTEDIHYESEDSDDDDEDEEEESEFQKECKKYESMKHSYSKEFREKCEKDAYKKRKFWHFVCNKMKNNKELRKYCRLREATQSCREFIYTGYNLFKVRHLFFCDSMDIRNEECHIVDIQNNDHLEVSINFTLGIKNKEEYTDAFITRKGCYDSGIYNSYDISNLDGVHMGALKRLFVDLFETFCPSYMF